MFHMKNPTIARIIINKDNKISRSTNTRDRGTPPNIKMNRSKISVDIDSLALKGKAGCFLNWHETQSKFYVDTDPNKPLEANCYTREEDAWPSPTSQSAGEGIEETTAAATTEIGATSGRHRLSMRNIHPTLEPVPSSCPVLESYTIHPENKL